MTSTHKVGKLQGLIATEDGEILHTGVVTVQSRRHKFSEDYMSFFLGGFESLALMTRPQETPDGKAPAKLGMEAISVLLYCLSRLDTSNQVDIRKQTEIADALGVKSASVSRSLKKLCAVGIFTRAPDGRLSLSPLFGWRGKVSEHKKAAAAANVKLLDARWAEDDKKVDELLGDA
jgi:hypothetical protein